MAKEGKATVSVFIDGKVANVALRDLQSEARKLQNEIARLTPGTQEFINKTKQLQEVKARINSVKDDISGLGGAFSKIKDEVKQFGMLAAGALGFQWLSGQITNIIGKVASFEKSVSNLSAITGLQGSELEYLKVQAKEVSKQFGMSAKDVVEAYKLIGSAKPELLKNKEGLAAITKEAIALAQASGLEVPQAATALTDALNQFGAPAEEASKYINILAEGAKLGAAEVPEVTEALLKFGVAAKASNVTIAESTALIETLAEKGLKGAEAGTQLRNVLAKLSAPETLPKTALMYLEQAGVNLSVLSDQSKSFTERLNELAKIEGNAAALTETFGLENKNAAQVLIENRKRVDELSKALGGNLNTAYEQAAINTDNLDFKLKKIGNSVSSFLSSLFSKPLESFANWLVKISETPLSEKMEQERIELQKTHIQLLSTNVSHEQRVKLIDQLKAKYPEYLSHIDSETVSNTELSKALNQVNEKMINKIILQRKDEELQERNNNAAELKMKMLDAEDKLRTAMAKRQKDYTDFKFKDGLNEVEQAKEFLKYLEGHGSKQQTIFHDEFRARGEITRALNNYIILQEMSQHADQASNNMLKERMDLMKRLGIEESKGPIETHRGEGTEKPSGGGHIAVNPKQVAKEEKELDNLKKKLEDFYSDVDKLSVKHFESTLHQNAQELADIDEKYSEMERRIEEFYSNPKLKPEDRARLAQEFNELEKQRNEEKTNAIKKQEENLSKELIRLHEEYLSIVLSDEQKEIKAVVEKYNKLRSEAVGHKDLMEKIEKEKEEAIAAIHNKYNDKKAEEDKTKLQEFENIRNDKNERMLMGNMGSREREIHEIEKYWDKQIELAAGNEELIKELKIAKAQEVHDKKMEFAKEDFLAVANFAGQLADNYLAVEEQKRQNDLNRNIKHLEKQKAIELSNKNLTEAQRKQIEDKYAALEKKEKQKAWEAQQKAAKAQAIINGALALVNIAATMPWADFGVAHGIAIAAVIASTATQVAKIEEQEMPEFAEGGHTLPTFKKGGPVNGARIGLIGEAGPEWVAPNWMLENPATGNIIGMLENIRASKFAVGGFTANSFNANNQSNPAGSSINSEAMIMVLADISNKLDKPSIAIMDYDYQTKRDAELSEIQKRANMTTAA